MSFEDFYHPDRASPYGRSPGRAGMETGATIGAMFGPTGAAIGALVGGIGGSVFGSKGEGMRARRKATQESYAFGKDLF